MEVDVGARTVFEGASSDRVGLVDPEVRNDPKLSADPCATQMDKPLLSRCGKHLNPRADMKCRALHFLQLSHERHHSLRCTRRQLPDYSQPNPSSPNIKVCVGDSIRNGQLA